jgi:hypothetical protein
MKLLGFSGYYRMNQDTVDAIIKKARAVNPNVKRLYIGIEQSGYIRFIIHKRDNRYRYGVRPIVVHTGHVGSVKLIPSRRLDESNGYPYCLSIPATEAAKRACSDPTTFGLNFEDSNHVGVPLSCRFNSR